MNPFYNLNSKLRQPNKRIKKRFDALQLPFEIKNFEQGGRTIQYLESGNLDAPTIIFIHGAPGGLDAFLGYHLDIDLSKRAHLISVDRPGYGNSGFGKAVPSIVEQAQLLSPLLGLNRSGELPLVIGHSYGGPIAACLAMEYPEQLDSLILIAAALDPQNEKLFWFNTPANWSFVKAIIPGALNVANTEKQSHAKALEALLGKWENIHHFVSLIHGKRDGIVPFENALFAKEALINARVDFIADKQMNHLIPWNRPDFVKSVIFKHLSSIKSENTQDILP